MKKTKALPEYCSGLHRSILQTSLSLLIFIFFTAFYIAGAEAKELKLAAPEWEPYTGEHLQQSGVAAEIAATAFKRSGYTVEYHFMPWVRVQRDVARGKYDAACFGYFSEERERTFLLSEPIMSSVLGFFALKSSDIRFDDLHDLKGRKIGVVRGYINSAQFDAATYLDKDEAQSDVVNFKKLIAGRVEMIVCDKLVGLSIIHDSFAGHKDDIVFLEPSLQSQALHLMLSRKIPEGQKIVDDFNAGLSQMRHDGTISQIIARHGFADSL